MYPSRRSVTSMVPDRITAIVLAAGQSTRFGGRKLTATLDGLPLLQHVLDALAAAGIPDPVVVEDGGASDPRVAGGPGLHWGGARRIANPDPSRGLASSLHLGWAAAMASDPSPEAVLVVLGDQPALDPVVIRRLMAEPADPSRPVVIARFSDGSRNPVRLEPDAADLVAAATGDRGLGPLLDARPGFIRVLDVNGGNPDIDDRADLVRLLADRWAERVRGNAAQVERFREEPDGPDFYASVSRTFIDDPGRGDDPVLAALLELVRPDDTWLDIGAGAGRYALPLARHAREVVAVDPSPAMLAALTAGMAEHGIQNLRALEGRWPPDPALRARLGQDPVADVALIAHVSYDIAEIVPFIEAMEQAARRACAAILMDGSPASAAAPFWPIAHGEERIALPALNQFVEVLQAGGRSPVVELISGERRRWQDPDELLRFLRRQVWTAPGTEADRRLVDAIPDLTRSEMDGSVEVIALELQKIGIVTWAVPEVRAFGAGSV